MEHSPVICLLYFYGIFLIFCGIISVIFIGARAKTALISGGSSGMLCLGIAYLMGQSQNWAFTAGLLISLMLAVVFAWRAGKTLFSLFEMIQTNDPLLKGKGVAFLIISLMCIVSLFIFILQVIFCKG